MLIGYARVSSDDQNLNLQKDALTRTGCERILEDRQSGAKADRAGLRDALDYARDGDTLTVWRLDRLSRSLKDLMDLVSQLARIDHRFGNEGDFGRPERFSESFAIDPVQVE